MHKYEKSWNILTHAAYSSYGDKKLKIENKDNKKNNKIK